MSISILVSIIITLTLLSIADSIAAVAAEVDWKKKVIELRTAGLLLPITTFLL